MAATNASNRGFAGMDEDARRAIASKGGKARHANRAQSSSTKRSSITRAANTNRQDDDHIIEHS